MENKDSIFAGLNPAPAPAPFVAAAKAKPENEARVAGLEASVKTMQAELALLKQAPAHAQPENDVRVAGLEASVKTLQAEIDILEQAASRPRPPVSAKVKADGEARVAGLEASVKALQAEIAILERAAARPAPPVNAKQADQDLALRLERLEKSVAELSAQQVRAKLVVSGDISKEELEKVNSGVSNVLSLFESIKNSLTKYSDDFSGIERQCGKYLGEIQSYIKDIDRKPAPERSDESLKESVSQLNDKLVEVVKAMHAGLSELSSRLKTSEVLYGKIFAEAEDRLKKGLEPEVQAVNGRLQDLRAKVTWLTEEYSIVMERKMRALEAKYSAFDVISARIDNINQTLKPETGAEAHKRKV